MKEHAGIPLVVQTDSGAEKGVTTAGFVIFLPSGWELVRVGRIDAGFTNNKAELIAIC